MSSVKTGSGYPHALRSELHKALDAAGIQYWMAQGLTFWNCEDGRECVGYGFDASDGTPMLAVKVVGIREPEQAIAMTVGAGTCKLVDNDSGPDMHCTACGGGIDDEYRYFMDSWGYSRCPHCGARIIEEATE